MKKAHILILILLFIVVASTAGCQGSKTTTETGSPSQTATDLNALQGKSELTSQEAAAFAYQEAKKWRSDAALYYLTPVAAYLSPQWRQNDSASEWAVMFANPQNNSTFNVTIKNGKITRAAEENIEKSNVVNASLPVDRIGVSMKQAGEVVYANNAPAGLQPLIVYQVRSKTNKIYPGIAVWTFGFIISSKSVEETVAYIYFIDGQTGKLLTINDAQGNPATPPAQLSVLPQQSGKEPVQQFLSSLGSGNADAALALMDANMLGNSANQQAWRNNFSTIASLTVVSIEEYSKPEWTDVSQMFKVQLSVHLKPGSASLGWLEGNNTRWISLKAENGQWKIHELANNP